MLVAYRTLWTNRPLVRFVAGEFVSSVGDWLYLVAMLVLVYEQAGSAVLLGIIGAARILPYVILSVPAGMVVDRVDRRRLIIATDLIRGVLMAVMAVMSIVHPPVALLLAVAILATCASTFNRPAFAAFLPSLAADESQIGPANSLWSSLDNAAYVVGPAIAGVLIAAGGLTLGFALNAASFLVVALVVVTLPRAAPRSTSEVATKEAIAMRRVPITSLLRRIRGPLALEITGSLAFGGLGVLTVVLAAEVFHASDAATGFLNAAFGVGGVIGSLLAGILVLRRLDVPLVAGAALTAVGLGVLGATNILVLGLVAVAAAIAGASVVEVIGTTLIQRAIPDDARGRIFGVVQMLSAGAFSVGSFVAPVLAALVGLAPVLVGGGVLFLAAASFAAVSARAAAATPRLDAERRRVLSLPVFAGVASTRLEEAAARLEPIAVTAGATIIREGDPADAFYIIAVGRFAACHDAPGAAAPSLLREMGPDDVFGQLGLLGSIPRTATVRAVTDGRLLALDGATFLDLVRTGADVRTRLLDMHSGLPVLTRG